MTYFPGDLRARSRDLISARNWGVTAVAGLLGLRLFASEVTRITELPVDVLSLAYLATLGMTGLLIFLWVWATQYELDLLFDWLDPERYVPPSSVEETLLIVAIGVVLSAMFLVARDPTWYGVVFVLYSIVQITAGHYAYSEVKEAITHSRRRLAQEPTTGVGVAYGEGVAILEAYFVGRPLIQRCFWILVGAGVGLALAVSSKVFGHRVLAVAAYVVYFGTIAFSEALVGRWRSQRDRRLRPVAAELSEGLRQTSRE